jgi:serine/threonine protein kinase
MVLDNIDTLRSNEEFCPLTSVDRFKKQVRRVLNQVRVVSILGHGKKELISRCDVVGGLGEGSFGLVLLLRDRHSAQEYALKAVSKAHLKTHNQESMLYNERRLLTCLSHSDFFVSLHGVFEDSQFTCLLLDCVFGGELFDVYSDGNLWGSMKHARFYAASVALGLSHMHEKRIVWRDLKLENILLDLQGYIKFTDFGIAKQIIGKTYTVCGTADYFAPETLRQSGHNRGVDWWACGVLIFIMTAGKSPFDAPSAQQIYKNIIKGISKVRFPSNVTQEAKDVICALLQKKPEDRLPMQKGGVSNLMQMPFFSGLDVDDILERRIEAPHIPPPPNYDQIASRQLSRPVDIDWDEMVEVKDSVLEMVAAKNGSHASVHLPAEA